jgi:kinesin family protein 5
VYVEGLSSFNVNSPEEVLALLEQGNENREVASTKMNAHSSRSHAVFILHVQRRNRTGTLSEYSGDQQQQVQHSKLVLVDLAGSERAKRTIDSSAGGRYLQFTELKVCYCARLCAFS